MNIGTGAAWLASLSQRGLSEDRKAAGIENILEIEQLRRRFGDLQVIGSLDLEIEPGQRVALAGPNGSGKTTVLRCVAGSLKPTSGDVRIGRYEAGSIQARKLLGVSLSQERSFYYRLSGRENLRFFARLHFGNRRLADNRVTSIEKELELFEITSQRVDRCSTGMLQQLALARALLGEPQLVLLDEPTRSLDKAAVKRLWTTLDRRPSLAVLIATHREEDLARCGRRVDLPV